MAHSDHFVNVIKHQPFNLYIIHLTFCVFVWFGDALMLYAIRNLG